MDSAPAVVPIADGTSISTTYWCHECEMSVIIVSHPIPNQDSNPIHCPHCRSLFLEELDSNPQTQRQRQTITIIDSSDSDDPDLLPSDPNPNPSSSPNPNPTAYLHLLIQHLAGDDSSYPSDLPLPLTFPNHQRSRGPSPAPKSSIESIPFVEISDPSLLCAICKDEFPLRFRARKLPCSHIYHSECIIPWLSSNNSCPLCRFRFPGGPEGDAGPAEGRRVSGSIFGGRLVRGIARRQRLVLAGRRVDEGEEGVIATQIAELVGAGGGPTNSGETVLSEWPVEGVDSAGVVSGARERMSE